jgi:hypothetical protein
MVVVAILRYFWQHCQQGGDTLLDSTVIRRSASEWSQNNMTPDSMFFLAATKKLRKR